MEEPENADTRPRVLKVAAGDYLWCSCGRSEVQPYCDGSHRGTGLGPVKMTVEEEKAVAFCNCKRTKTPPFCDGSHNTL